MMMLRESHPHKPHVSSVVTEGTERESVMHVRCVHSKCKSKTKLTKVRFLRKPRENAIGRSKGKKFNFSAKLCGVGPWSVLCQLCLNKG